MMKNKNIALLISAFPDLEASGTEEGRSESEDINRTDALQRTPLHRAAANGDIDIVMALIDKGADMSKTDSKGNTPLHEALMNGYTDIAKALINKGSPLGYFNDDLQTPLHLAVMKNKTDIVKTLIANGSDVNKKAVHAAIKDYTDIAKALIEKDVKLDVHDLERRTPLYWACFHGHSGAAMRLLKNGARHS